MPGHMRTMKWQGALLYRCTWVFGQQAVQVFVPLRLAARQVSLLHLAQVERAPCQSRRQAFQPEAGAKSEAARGKGLRERAGREGAGHRLALKHALPEQHSGVCSGPATDMGGKRAAPHLIRQLPF